MKEHEKLHHITNKNRPFQGKKLRGVKGPIWMEKNEKDVCKNHTRLATHRLARTFIS